MPKIIYIKKWDIFWKLSIIKEIYTDKVRRFECKCECWNITTARLTNLRQWKVLSCWCLSWKWTKHWMKSTKIYWVYAWIKSRCNNKNTQFYKDYGGRWIKCEWETFEEFYKDMWDSYKEWLTIDRINNDWNYTKENCRWTTQKIQSWNRRNSIIYKWKCLKHWCEELWICQGTIKSRIKNWWDLKEAIFTPIWKPWISIK